MGQADHRLGFYIHQFGIRGQRKDDVSIFRVSGVSINFPKSLLIELVVIINE
jgi:hypothetical protein